GPTDPTPLAVERAPEVAAVFARGTAWTPAFLNSLQSLGEGDAAYGYALKGGSAQAKTLPWDNLDRVSVRFTENVVVGPGDLTVFSAASGGSYALSAAQFSYDPATFTATWAFAAPLGADKLRLVLASGAGAVRSATDGQPLDGEWADGTASFNSGNGQPGGDFAFAFHALPGDVTQSGAVNVTD